VQISFFSQVYDYFYQSVSTSLWKNEDTEKWTLNVESWLEEETYLRDRTSLREKIVGEVAEFESVDEAIRYAIDWVISFPTKDLGAQIYGTTWWDEALNPTMKDLEAQIRSFGSITYSSSFDLRAMTTPFHPRDLGARMRIIDYWADMPVYIKDTHPQLKDLAATVKIWGPLSVHIDFPEEAQFPPHPNAAQLMFDDSPDHWVAGVGKGWSSERVNLIANIISVVPSLAVEIEFGAAPNDPPEGNDIDIDFN
jgi:hypothetical protein